MKIILGIFGFSYERLQEKTQAVAFFERPVNGKYQRFTQYSEEQYYEIAKKHNIIHIGTVGDLGYSIIGANILEADEIVFDLTEIYAPFPKARRYPVTITELLFIHIYNLMDKTTFYVNGEVIDKQIVLDLLTLPRTEDDPTLPKWEFYKYHEVDYKKHFNHHFK